jgi:hypothetical protein
MRNKTFKIMGKYAGRAWEIIDTCTGEREACRMLREYAMAFGRGWQLEIR